VQSGQRVTLTYTQAAAPAKPEGKS
jgi:hypothetical protein